MRYCDRSSSGARCASISISYISVSCASNMMIRFYIYMDHLFQLLRNLNSLAFYLIENSVLYPILNISKLNV